MQILFGAHETVVKVNSKSISIDYIQHFINTHFSTRKIKNNFIVIPASHDDVYHRTFLLKWLYSLYTKKNKPQPELKELLLKRHYKAIKIITNKKIIHTLSYNIIDKETIQIQIKPANSVIAYKLKMFLQTKITLMPTYLQITISSQKERQLLFQFINTKDILNIPHQHYYNKKKMKLFLFPEQKKEDFCPILDAYTILGISKNDTIKTVKKRYKLLAKEFHPDNVYTKDKNMIQIYTKKFQVISEAYKSILLDFPL